MVNGAINNTPTGKYLTIICNTCRTVKESLEFYPDKENENGYSSHCKTCLENLTKPSSILKICTSCKIEKTAPEHFTNDRTSASGYASQCRLCKSISSKKSRARINKKKEKSNFKQKKESALPFIKNGCNTFHGMTERIFGCISVFGEISKSDITSFFIKSTNINMINRVLKDLEDQKLIKLKMQATRGATKTLYSLTEEAIEQGKKKAFRYEPKNESSTERIIQKPQINIPDIQIPMTVTSSHRITENTNENAGDYRMKTFKEQLELIKRGLDNDQKFISISSHIPQSLHKEIKELSEKHNTTISTGIRIALQSYFEQDDSESKNVKINDDEYLLDYAPFIVSHTDIRKFTEALAAIITEGSVMIKHPPFVANNKEGDIVYHQQVFIKPKKLRVEKINPIIAEIEAIDAIPYQKSFLYLMQKLKHYQYNNTPDANAISETILKHYNSFVAKHIHISDEKEDYARIMAAAILKFAATSFVSIIFQLTMEHHKDSSEVIMRLGSKTFQKELANIFATTLQYAIPNEVDDLMEALKIEFGDRLETTDAKTISFELNNNNAQ